MDSYINTTWNYVFFHVGHSSFIGFSDFKNTINCKFSKEISFTYVDMHLATRSSIANFLFNAPKHIQYKPKFHLWVFTLLNLCHLKYIASKQKQWLVSFEIHWIWHLTFNKKSKWIFICSKKNITSILVLSIYYICLLSRLNVFPKHNT